VEHRALTDFIINQKNIKIDDGAKRHLQKEKSFL
jgi:hypothetical protein